jgi:hypothetical protein
MVRPRTRTTFDLVRRLISSTSISIFRSHRTLITFRSFSWRMISCIVLSVHPFFPIQTVGFRLWIGSSPLIPSHHRIPSLPPASEAGDNHLTPVHPHPHRCTGGEECRTSPTELPSQFPGNANPLLHGDDPRTLNTAIAPRGMCRKECCSLLKKPFDPLTADLLRIRAARLRTHKHFIVDREDH